VQDASELVARECPAFLDDDVAPPPPAFGEQQSVSVQGKSKSKQYCMAYTDLLTLVDQETSSVKAELRALLFPIFAHMYLSMVVAGDRTAGKTLSRQILTYLQLPNFCPATPTDRRRFGVPTLKRYGRWTPQILCCSIHN
jgi:hypothetical protein